MPLAIINHLETAAPMKILGLIPALALILASAPANASSTAGVVPDVDCDPISGLSQVLEKPDLKYLILGEIHGTEEIPRFAGDVACLASLDRPLVVALELPVQIQGDVDAYLSSDGGPEAQASLLASRYWSPQFADGRSSRAIVDLLDELRTLRAAGRRIEVKASRASAGRLGPDSSDLLTAAEWTRAAMTEPSALVVVLVGRAHAGKAPTDRLRPAASLLPPAATTSLTVAADGGSFWGCLAEGCDRQVVQDRPDSRSRGVYLDAPPAGFDGVFAIGGPLRPSGPAASSR